jgi:predicted Zn-dependent protease
MLKSSQGLMEDAEVNFRAAVSLSPGFVDAHACLGLLLSNRQRAKEAEDVLRKAVSLAPGRGDIVHGLTRLLTETGRAEESVAVIRAAQRVNPNDAFLQDKLCMMLNYIAGVSDEELLAAHRRVRGAGAARGWGFLARGPRPGAAAARGVPVGGPARARGGILPGGDPGGA